MSQLSVTDVSHAIFDSPEIHEGDHFITSLVNALTKIRVPMEQVNDVVRVLLDQINTALGVQQQIEINNSLGSLFLAPMARELRTNFEQALGLKETENPDFLNVPEGPPQPR